MKRLRPFIIRYSLQVCLLLPLLCSCSDDWDNHYKESNIAGETLWTTLSSDPELSNFVSVLNACGYESSLNSSQVFTVFAPTNASLSAADRDSLISRYNRQKNSGINDKNNTSIKEFVQNHIALYNYSVSSLTDDSIRMMNGKSLPFSTENFAGAKYINKNIPASNGLLYTIGNVVDYSPNVYEYIARDASLSGVYEFLHSFDVDKFDPSQSVPGEIVDGKTVYLDSVTVLENVMLGVYLGKIYNEDSTYWMVVPTNEVWDTLVARYSKLYEYDKLTVERDTFSFLYPRFHALFGSVFSRTKNTDKSICDSVEATTALPYKSRYEEYGSYDKRYCVYDKPFKEGGVFYNTEDHVCSNGLIKKVDKLEDWNFDPYNTFIKDIIMEGEETATLDSVDSKSTRELSFYNVTTDNPFYNKVSGHGYAQMQPSGSSAPKAVFNIANVRSNLAYDVYVVVAPALAGDTAATALQCLPTIFRSTLYYHDLSGKEVKFATSANKTTDPTKVDSVYIGTYVFPTCSYDLSEPQVKMLIESRVSNTQERNGTHTKTLRLDAIVFKPNPNPTTISK